MTNTMPTIFVCIFACICLFFSISALMQFVDFVDLGEDSILHRKPARYFITFMLWLCICVSILTPLLLLYHPNPTDGNTNPSQYTVSLYDLQGNLIEQHRNVSEVEKEDDSVTFQEDGKEIKISYVSGTVLVKEKERE